jgi:hypothetical protein
MVNCSFLEADRSVVVDLCDLVGTIVFWLVLRVFTSFDQCFVSKGASMRASRFVLALVIFVNSGLFLLPNVFPIRHMFHI